jgi:hypothetical protein
MPLGRWGRKPPPHKAAAYGLIAVGAVIMLLSMPLFVYAAVIGGLVAYVGYTMRGR